MKPDSGEREDLWRQFVTDTGWVAPTRDADDALASAWNAWLKDRRVSIHLSLAQRILTALETESEVNASRGWLDRVALLDALAAKLRERMPK